MDSKPLRGILSMEGAVDRVFQQMKQKKLSSFSTSLEDARSRYGEKLKHIEEVSEEVRQTEVKDADLRREVEGLAKQKQELRVLL
ncbi:hypothetical protein LIER_17564 [Lithospermum erythrorhizon]|uniref:Uncharacterized protein n=1 Tax=Lithospermum erythrorhizon TaxID=34254 RepID=A0AAV3QE27_LITER